MPKQFSFGVSSFKIIAIIGNIKGPNEYPNKRTRKVARSETVAGVASVAPPGMITCEHCGKFYKTTNSLRVHKIRQHKHDFIA